MMIKKGYPESVAVDVSNKIEAELFIYGMIQKSTAGISIDAQLIETKTGEVIKSFKAEGHKNKEAIFSIIDF